MPHPDARYGTIPPEVLGDIFKTAFRTDVPLANICHSPKQPEPPEPKPLPYHSLREDEKRLILGVSERYRV